MLCYSETVLVSKALVKRTLVSYL